mmetsp:Transcript_37727/g.88855  ORF Transcript_37727/g.88855 Transcript_37727/m.88855 type:complete len:211 (-) Transcript_37727:121-753(-)|eukprot:1263659-Rhodomonas_salina.1
MRPVHGGGVVAGDDGEPLRGLRERRRERLEHALVAPLAVPEGVARAHAEEVAGARLRTFDLDGDRRDLVRDHAPLLLVVLAELQRIGRDLGPVVALRRRPREHDRVRRLLQHLGLQRWRRDVALDRDLERVRRVARPELVHRADLERVLLPGLEVLDDVAEPRVARLLRRDRLPPVRRLLHLLARVPERPDLVRRHRERVVERMVPGQRR